MSASPTASRVPGPAATNSVTVTSTPVNAAAANVAPVDSAPANAASVPPAALIPTPTPCFQEGSGGGFRVGDDGARWVCQGGVTFSNAGQVLEASLRLPLPATGIVDCEALHPVDSAAVAVLLALKRRAATEGKPLTFINITDSLHTLADLYGVEELLVAATIR